VRLALAAAGAQLADLLTATPEQEANPFAIHPLGPVAKVLLIIALLVGVKAVGPKWRVVLVTAILVGLLGLASNLL